jgi:hypothetical protein
VTIGIAVGVLGINALDKMHDTLSILEGDVKVIKYQIERDYFNGGSGDK